MICSGVKVHLPLENKRLNGLKRNLSAIPAQVDSMELRGRSSSAGHLLSRYMERTFKSLQSSSVSVSLRARIEAITSAQYSFCHSGISISPGRIGKDSMN